MKNCNGQATVIEHLEEFRLRLIKCLIIFIFLLPVAWFFALPLIEWISEELCPPELGAMYYSQPMEFFFLRLKMSCVIALCVEIPYVAWNLWQYLSPALLSQEKRLIGGMSFASFILFAIGGALALLFVFPTLMKFSIDMQTDGIKPLINIASCLGMVVWLLLGFGICFQLPIVLLGLIKLRLVSVERLKILRPYIIVGIFLVAGVLTPPDIISQLTMALPTWLLYEGSLLIGQLIERKNSDLVC